MDTAFGFNQTAVFAQAVADKIADKVAPAAVPPAVSFVDPAPTIEPVSDPICCNASGCWRVNRQLGAGCKCPATWVDGVF